MLRHFYNNFVIFITTLFLFSIRNYLTLLITSEIKKYYIKITIIFKYNKYTEQLNTIKISCIHYYELFVSSDLSSIYV